MRMQVKQPYDGALIEEVELDDAAAIENKLTVAAKIFADRGSWLPAYRRMALLRKLASLVQRDCDLFASLIAREGGKPLTDARSEVVRAVAGIDGAASEIEQMAGFEVPMGLTAAAVDRWAFTTKEPIGVVVAISAFNHPLNLIVHQVVPAIATGCPVLVKPAATTPLSCIRFVQLVHEAGLPLPWCQTVLVEDNKLAESLVTDARVAFFSFIGSARVGWYLRSKLAAGTRFALEHGGAAPVLVDQSADIDHVIGPLAKGGYYHAGQVCVSVQRIFIHESLKETFVERFVERVNRLIVGDPTLEETEVGPLILPREVDRVEDWVAQVAGDSGVLRCGGVRISDRLYQPTVLVEPPATSRVSTHEIFGPVTCIFGFSDLTEAVQRANSLPFAFQASIFTSRIDSALNAARLLDASAVMVNDHTAFRTDWMPFAGRRQSGYGTGGIPFSMRDMLQDKMIVFKLPG